MFLITPKGKIMTLGERTILIKKVIAIKRMQKTFLESVVSEE